MLVVTRKNRERITLKPTTPIKYSPSVPLESLDNQTLLELAAIGKTFVDHPIKILVAGLDPGRVRIGLDELDKSIACIWS